MRIVPIALAVGAASALLAGCGSGGLANRSRPDEFAVARQAPLIVPPDFALVPPRPGEPSPATADGRTQALQALFGGPAPRSAVENQMLRESGSDRADPGARSVAGDPKTNVVDKGSTTQVIVAAPAGAGQEATVSTPQ
ncbi:MAG TPA: DUF3035 domain-containing protein [Allosphingosinicella sp.]|nr:DUF3035 domain-containing protein [Allosphingosinicella sp.]